MVLFLLDKRSFFVFMNLAQEYYVRTITFSFCYSLFIAIYTKIWHFIHCYFMTYLYDQYNPRRCPFRTYLHSARVQTRLADQPHQRTYIVCVFWGGGNNGCGQVSMKGVCAKRMYPFRGTRFMDNEDFEVLSFFCYYFFDALCSNSASKK